ncbi:nuclear transport factor 2 family protein [Myxococcota bacterium]|nr:nuclear transport factor 2 family protein [Myxococcota bacterium]
MSLSQEDRASIEQLSKRYSQSIGNGDIEAALSLFAPDANLEARLESWMPNQSRYPAMQLFIVGHAGLMEFFTTPPKTVDSEHGSFADRSAVKDASQVTVLHLPTAQSIVEGDGHSAKMICYYTFHYLEDPPRMMSYGHYRDQLIKANGQWKISHRFVDIEWDDRVAEKDDSEGAGVEPEGSFASKVHASVSAKPLPEYKPLSLSSDDHAAIVELSTRYPNAVDYRDWDALLALFTEDVGFETQVRSWAVHFDRLPTMHMRMKGHDSLREQFARERTLFREESGQTQRGLPALHSVEQEGDTPMMIQNFALHSLDNSAKLLAYGQYRDNLEKVDGEWKIAHRLVDFEMDERNPN